MLMVMRMTFSVFFVNEWTKISCGSELLPLFSFLSLLVAQKKWNANRPRMYPWRYMRGTFFYCAKLTATTLPWQLFSSVFFLLPKDALLVLLIRRELFQAVSYETRFGSINKTIYHSCLDASVPEFLIEEYIIWIRAQMRRTNHFQPKALS